MDSVIVFSTTDMNKSNDKDVVEGATLVASGTAAGAGISATVGGMGLVGGFGGLAIGAVPVTIAGAMVGSAAYGVKKAIEDSDTSALGAVAIGGICGASASTFIGGMGLAVAGTAISVGMAPVIGAGAVIGMAGYGLKRLFSN